MVFSLFYFMFAIWNVDIMAGVSAAILDRRDDRAEIWKEPGSLSIHRTSG